MSSVLMVVENWPLLHVSNVGKGREKSFTNYPNEHNSVKKNSCPEDKRQQNMSNLEKKGVSYKLSALNQLLMYSSACAPVELKNLNPDNYM